MTPWTFTALDPKERIAELSKPTTSDAIFDLVAGDMKILCCHPQKCDENSQFKRVVWCARVAPPIFDLFFNSADGYRGAYFVSPGHGLNANRSFIERLSPDLITWMSRRCPDIPRSLATESLGSPSAKAWLAENGTDFCEHCAGQWSATSGDPGEIRNGRWEHGISREAAWGRQAPYLSKLKIFGAFIDDHHNVLVPHNKRHRAMEINKFGWS